jgi:hypothetical protein
VSPSHQRHHTPHSLLLGHTFLQKISFALYTVLDRQPSEELHSWWCFVLPDELGGGGISSLRIHQEPVKLSSAKFAAGGGKRAQAFVLIL